MSTNKLKNTDLGIDQMLKQARFYTSIVQIKIAILLSRHPILLLNALINMQYICKICFHIYMFDFTCKYINTNSILLWITTKLFQFIDYNIF